LDRPWHARLLRRLQDGAWREAGDLYRLAVSARDNDRADQFAVAVLKLEWARVSAGARLDGWRPALEALDETALNGLAQALKRLDQDQHRGGIDPPFWRTVLAVAVGRLQSEGRSPAALLGLLGQAPFRPTALDLELPAFLLSSAGVPLPDWASTALRAERLQPLQPRRDVPSLAPEIAAAVDAFTATGDEQPLLAFFSSACTALRGSDIGNALSALDALSTRHELHAPVLRLLEGLHALPWTDAVLRDALLGIRASLLPALAEGGWDAARWCAGMLGRIGSEYYGCLSEAARHLVGTLEAPALQRPLFDALLALAATRNERDARHRLAALGACCLVRQLEATGAGMDDDALSRLAEVERTVLPVADSDFLELALARAAGLRGDVEAVTAHFRRIRDPWSRGQALIRQDDTVAGNPRLWPLAAEVLQYDLAGALALRRFTETLRDGRPTADRFRALLAVIDSAPGAAALVPTHFADALVASAAAGPDRDEALAVLGEWLHAPLSGAGPDAIRQVLVTSLENGVSPSHWPGPLRGLLETDARSLSAPEREVLGALPSASSWNVLAVPATAAPDTRWEAWEAVIEGLPLGKLPVTAPVPDVLVAMTNAVMVPDEEWPTRLPPESARWLAAQVSRATPTPHALRLCLALAPAAEGVTAEDPLRYGLELGAHPGSFDPREALGRAGPLWRTVFRWMHEHGERSDIFTRHVHHPAVREFLVSCEEEVRQSGIARPHRPLARPGRRALMWMGTSWFTRGRPARILAGELTHRCATTREHAFVEAWLARQEERP
ncbi:MAG: hypothetical protein RL653_132, partial [Pseudomonadota bacterium]